MRAIKKKSKQCNTKKKRHRPLQLYSEISLKFISNKIMLHTHTHYGIEPPSLMKTSNKNCFNAQKYKYTLKNKKGGVLIDGRF